MENTLGFRVHTGKTTMQALPSGAAKELYKVHKYQWEKEEKLEMNFKSIITSAMFGKMTFHKSHPRVKNKKFLFIRLC